MTICRIWRGWTTPENAGAYEAIVRGELTPGQRLDEMCRRLLANPVVEEYQIEWVG